jgi:hypothetical protein
MYLCSALISIAPRYPSPGPASKIFNELILNSSEIAEKIRNGATCTNGVVIGIILRPNKFWQSKATSSLIELIILNS